MHEEPAERARADAERDEGQQQAGDEEHRLFDREPRRRVRDEAAQRLGVLPHGDRVQVDEAEHRLDLALAFGEALERAEGRDVIRLVTGNPLNRESIKAEISAVANAGMEFQVVPGMWPYRSCRDTRFPGWCNGRMFVGGGLPTSSRA